MSIRETIFGAIEEATGVTKLRADLDRVVNYVKRLNRRVVALEKAIDDTCVTCGGPGAMESGGQCPPCSVAPTKEKANG